MKVLIAEDEVQMNRVLTTALTHEGLSLIHIYKKIIMAIIQPIMAVVVKG